ncbi:unnamed protein product [Clonostachys solani]|uniref:ORC1/DEAH AAA+ ATPase domain-containing protein n=1 Tax=Clonostachys solani TaxID=160281 RepID=A0A9P0E860_9HYPO|nr:unnamed protein product [Clonostachys solani]
MHTLHLVYPPSRLAGHDAKLESVILPLKFVNAGAKRHSIIAVHGLDPQNRDDTAHAWDTWRTPSGPTGRLWLRDDLPGQIPPARIFVYEYNSTAAYETSWAAFIDQAQGLLIAVHVERIGVPISRPIIFLGHGMGGLLIKQALINARSDAWYQDIKDATHGLCFFATPHDGNGHAMVRLGRSLAKLAGYNVTAALKAGGMFAEAIAGEWRHQPGHYDCVSFWGSMDEVVPRESAQIGRASDREAIVMLKATHDNVCKFGYSEDDQDILKAVQSSLQGLCQRSLEKGESPVRLANDIAPTPLQGRTCNVETTMPQEDLYLPPPKNKSFTGRENILTELQNKFFVQAQCSRIAISGLGGVGKTEVALQLAHWVRETRPEVSVFWVCAASSNTSFKHVFEEIAEQLSIPLNNDTGDLNRTMQHHLSASWLNQHDTEGRPEVDNLRLATECDLARAYLQNKQRKEAIETLDGIIRVQREIVPAENQDWLLSEHEIARGYLDNEQIREGLEVLECVVKLQRLKMPAVDYDWISPEYDPRGAFYDWQLKEKIELVKHRRRVSTEFRPLYDHAWLPSRHEYACLYFDNVPIKEAIEILERAVWFRTDILLAEDRARLLSEDELARSRIDIHNPRIKEELVILEGFVRAQRDVLPAEDHNRLSSEYVLARAYVNNGRTKEAIEILEGIVRIERDTLPDDDCDRLCSQQALGHAYIEDGSFEDAVLILQDVVHIQKNTRPPDDPSRVNSEKALRVALEKSRGISRMNDENSLDYNLE